MAKDNMTIRFTPDGFSYSKIPEATTEQLDEAPLHEVTPGPDFQRRLHEEVLNVLPQGETPSDLVVEIVSTRVVALPSDVELMDEVTASSGAAHVSLAEQMYRATLSELEGTDEQVLTHLITLPCGQELLLAFGIDRELSLFLSRNFGEVTYRHHVASLIMQGSLTLGEVCLAVRCDEAFLEVALFRKRRLALLNVYRTSEPADRTYYVMNTWLREGLDQLHDQLLVVGQSDEGQQLAESVSEFVKNVNR